MLKFKNVNEFFNGSSIICSGWALEGYFLLSIVFDLAWTVIIVSPKPSVLLNIYLYLYMSVSGYITGEAEKRVLR